MAKFTVSIKPYCNLTKSLFVVLDPTVGSVNCSLFLKNLKNHFCDLTWLLEKNFVKHIESLPQRLSKKFIGENSSITDIAIKN